VAAAIGWIGAALIGLAVARRVGRSAALRARLLAQARLLPLALTVVLVPTQILAFVRFEAGGEEAAGPALVALAMVGLALLGGAVRAGRDAARGTRAVSRAWRRSAVRFVVPGWADRAWRIRRRYPVVAIIGILRPQLFVAGQVADACTGDELAAIAAHERAHVRAGDNLLRWLFRLTPGAGVFARIGEPLERAWMAAAEEAADAAARRQASPLELASALTKVARLAAGIPTEAITTSALVGGSDLKARIERLLAAPTVDRVSQLGWLPAAVTLAFAAFLQSESAASTVHELFELLVRR
jgi:Zn-dependent protease with chaperone function